MQIACSWIKIVVFIHKYVHVVDRESLNTSKLGVVQDKMHVALLITTQSFYSIMNRNITGLFKLLA